MPDTPATPSSPQGQPSAGDPYDEVGGIYSGEVPAETTNVTTDSYQPPARSSGGGSGGGHDEDEDEDDGDDGDPRAKMGFFDHLEELRWTLVKCVGVFVLFFAINLFFISSIFQWMQWPLHYGLGEKFTHLKLNTIGEVFSVVIQVPFILGMGMALPMIVYFLANFVAPGLKKKEKSILTPACIAIFVLFLIGAAFSFFVLMPTTIKVAQELAQMLDLEIDWTADSYFDMLTWMLIGIGLAFEFPLVLLLLIYVGIVSTETLAKYRTHAFVFFLVFAALITPSTDPVTFLLLGIPLQALYEISLWVGKIIEKRKAQDELSD